MNVFSPDQSTQMANAVNEVYGAYAIQLEARVCSLARNHTEEDFSTWEFWQESRVGLWVPRTEKTEIELQCPGLQCSVTVNRATLGAALTMMAVNHQIWEEHHAGRDFRRLVALQDALAALVYADGSGFDESGISSFLD